MPVYLRKFYIKSIQQSLDDEAKAIKKAQLTPQAPAAKSLAKGPTIKK